MTFIEAMKIMWAVICLIIIIWALNADKKAYIQKQNENIIDDKTDDEYYDDFIMYDVVSDGEFDGNFSDDYQIGDGSWKR